MALLAAMFPKDNVYCGMVTAFKFDGEVSIMSNSDVRNSILFEKK